MSYNYGLTSIASIISGGANLVVQADTNSTSPHVRVFDFALLTTAAIVNLYAQNLVTGATTFVLHFDKDNRLMNNNAGIQFNGSVISSSNAVASGGVPLATITYIKEF